MSKKTVRKAPGNRKASQKKTKGLIAKGQKAGQSEQEECALDNLSHRTISLIERLADCRTGRSRVRGTPAVIGLSASSDRP